MSIIIKSGSSSNTANVTADGELQTTADASCFNGATWDKSRTANAADNTTGTGVPAAGLLAFDGTTWHRVKAGTGGDLAVSLTSPGGAAAGLFAQINPFGALNVSMDPTLLFAEAGDAAIDTVNKWSVAGTVAPTISGNNLLVNPGTTANATVALASIPTFGLVTPSTCGVKLALEAGPIATGNHRFFGLGTTPSGAGTAAAPLQDAIGFEIDTAGQMRASVYAAGTRIFAQPVTAPTDGAAHLYAVITRGDVTCWYIDTFVIPVATTTIEPVVQSLPVRVASLNGASTTVNTPLLTVTGIALYDGARQGTQISDGTFTFRKAQVGNHGGLSVKGTTQAATIASIAVATTGTVGPVDVSEMGNATIIVKNTVPGSAFTGTPVLVFEQSDDGVSWAPLAVTRADTNVTMPSFTLAANTANTAIVWNVALGGVNYIRVRVTTGPTGNAMTVAIQPGGFLVSPAMAIANPARTLVTFTGTALTPGVSGADTLLTLTRVFGPGTTNSANTFLISNARRLRITSVTFGMVNNTVTASATSCTFRLRYNAAGAVTTSSSVLFAGRTATAAQAGVCDRVVVSIPDGFELMGDGVAQIGVTAAATYTAQPTLDVLITGYEY